MLVRIYTHSFFDDLLGRDPAIFDLGANVGQFTNAMISRYGGHSLALEPSPTEFGQIPESASVTKLQAAVTSEPGEVVLNLATNSEANSIGKAAGYDYVDQVKVEALTLQDVLSRSGHDRGQLLKLDIEGSEIEVLNSPREVLQRFDQITAEFHDFCDITPREIVERTIAKVRGDGFWVFLFDRHEFRHADVLFVNKRRMSAIRYAWETAKLWAPRMAAAAARKVRGR